MARLILQPGKERSLMRRHPWIFAGSVGRLEGRARPGDTVEVVSADGKPFGRAAWSPESQIRARMWSFDADVTIDHAFFKRAVAASVTSRLTHPLLAMEEGVRLIHGESDGLPGVIADRYGNVVVLQLTSAGADKWREAIVAGLVQATGCAAVYERSDSEVRSLEGLGPVTGCVHGRLPDALSIVENGVRMGVDVVGGHKTGFYLDQRDNRLLTGRLAAGRRVLNCFCYTGGFSLQALAGGATSVLSIDSSGPALEAARANLAMNPQLDASI
jgi:23S rRNA (cytosine1962-C5)-methyltransferase